MFDYADNHDEYDDIKADFISQESIFYI